MTATLPEPRTATVTKAEATKLLDALNGAKERLLLDLGNWNACLLRIHDTGAHLALGWQSWSQFCVEQGIDRSASYRALDHAAAMRMLGEAGAKVKPSAVSKRAAEVIVKHPEAAGEIAGGASVREAVNRRREVPSVARTADKSEPPGALIVVSSRPVESVVVDSRSPADSPRSLPSAVLPIEEPSLSGNAATVRDLKMSVGAVVPDPVRATIDGLLLLFRSADLAKVGRVMTLDELDAVSMGHDVLTEAFYSAHPKAVSGRKVPELKAPPVPVAVRSSGPVGRSQVTPMFKQPKAGRK